MSMRRMVGTESGGHRFEGEERLDPALVEHGSKSKFNT